MKMVPAPPPTSSSSPMMSSSQHQKFEVTEDTPVDFLEGCMEILVVFPNEKSILMSIQRRMPMLDLLIHVTAANKISPAAHLLQVTDEEGRLLPHKPSTPIGSLNAHKVYIVSKNRLMSDRSTRSTKSSATTSQFEQSFRVQVRLPRNQLFVTRVTGRTQLGDLLHTVCNEKALDPRHYELRHPVNQDERLRLSNCLDDYKLQEVVLVPSGGKISQQQTVLSVHDLPTTMNKKSVTVSNSSVGGGASKMPGKSALRSTSSEATLAHTEKKKRGLFGLLGFGKHKKGSSMGDSSISSDSAGDRSISPSRSEEPPAPPPPEQPVVPTPPSPVLVSKRLAEEAVAKRNSRLSQMSAEAAAQSPLRTTSNGVAPARPAAKKKRAPPPPSSEPSPPPPTAVTEKTCSEVSSSSSTSVIHQVETTTRSKSPSEESGSSSPKTSNLLTTPAVSSSNLTQVSSTSNASLASAIKKRKAPVPPPALREQAEADQVNGSHHHHDESDRASSVSDQMSSVSDMSSPVKSATPEVSVNKEEEHEEELDHSAPPKPAARTRIVHSNEHDATVRQDDGKLAETKRNAESDSRLQKAEKIEAPPKPMKRKKWDRPVQVVSRNESDSSGDEAASASNSVANRSLRAISRGSSVSEFFSLSEAEDDNSPVQEALPNHFREEDEAEDPDVAFALMCAALARRKQQGDLSVEMLHDDTLVAEDDRRRSSAASDAGWIVVKESSRPSSSLARRSSSLDSGQHRRDSLPPPPLFPPLANSFFSAALSTRGEYEDIPLLLIAHDGQPPRHQGLDSPRSSAAASPDAISGRPVDTPSEDDYEVLNYKKQEEQVEVKAEEEKVNSGTYSQAQENEEIVISEPIYTMVIKSPKPLRAVDWDEKINAEPDKIIPTADDNRAEEEAEPEERNAGDGQTESPVMWEYKLPAPPTPFQDSGDSPMDKLQFASVTESNHSRPGSSMSADSLQEQSSADEEEVERPKIVTGIDTTVELCHGKELVEESNTEDVPLDCSTDVVEQVVVLEPSDPEAKQFGIESTTDEQPLSLPPAVPSTLPPCDSEDSSLQSEMKFSIATYNIRTTEDSTYDKKLSRSNSPDEMPANLIASPIEDNEPISVAIETKEPDVVSDAAAKTSGTVPNVQPNVPLINADLMQQFQNSLFVLHSISDPKARALQEEFLRLQQQLLTLQMQSVVQQANEIVSPVTQPTVDVPDKSPVVEEVEKVDIVPTTNTESKVVEPVSSPPESITDSSLEIKSEETSTETDIPVYRYTGPPQVKLDTWKPGRPRSEIVDYSRSSSFNVPLAPAVEQPIIAKPVEKSVESAPMPPPAVSNEVSEPAPLSLILEEETKSVIIESNDNSMEEKADGGGSPIDPKPVVLRKSSFLTARPFEARPTSMPIKRPTFTPMIIQPVPFVSRKIRAPEVRGFASLPPVTTNEMAAPVRMTTPTGPAPFSAVNKPRSISVVSKENPTIAIRNKLIESARRPSAELNGAPFKNEISSIPVNNESETKESTPNVIELRRNSTSNRPINMPVSSSLLLAAGAGVQKSQPVIIPESVNPIVTATTAPPQQSVIPTAAAADPVSTNARRSLSSKFVRKVDPREELLNSIRNFANGGSLRKTGTNLEN